MTMSTHVTQIQVGSNGVSFLAALSRTISNEPVTLYVTRGTKTFPLGTDNPGPTPSNLIGGSVSNLVTLVPGTFVFNEKDVSGATLATGTLEITE